FFFFQAEDGIRDGHVTGVQTCALPISDGARSYPIVREIPRFVASDLYTRSFSFEWNVHDRTQLDTHRGDTSSERMLHEKTGLTRSEERRVGKEWRTWRVSAR